MQIQIITTHEEMQQLFDGYHEKSLLNHQAKAHQSNPIIINGEELAKQLGVTIQTLIRWRKKEKIPFFRIGSSIRYDLNKVLEALESGKKGKGTKNV